MPIAPTVPTTTPALEAERTLTFFAQKVQDALNEIATASNTNESGLAAKAGLAVANAFAASSSSALINLAQSGTGPALVIENVNTRMLALMKDGKTYIGDQQTGVTFGSGAQIRAIGGVSGLIKAVLAAFGNNANGYQITFYKSRSLTVEGRDSVASNDDLGSINFNGDAGASEEDGIRILAEVDGVVSEAATILTIVRAANVVTITTTAAHGILVGNPIAVEAVVKTAFNGNFTVSTVPTTTTLTYAQVSGDDSDATGIVARRNLPSRLSIHTRAANDAAVTERFRVNSYGEVGLGNQTTLGRNVHNSKSLTNSVSVYGYSLAGEIQSDVVTAVHGFSNAASVADAVFTLANLYGFIANVQTFGTKATITNLHGFVANSGLTGGVSNFGFRSALADNSAAKTITTVVRASNVVTTTTSAAHGYAVGQQVTHAAITDAGFNGTFTITEVPTTTTYKHAQTAADASSTGGTSTPTAAGGGRWNVYSVGTAPNYFAGNVLVGHLIPVANSSLLQTSNGIGFPATQVALSNPNTLDDYEEGIFTPVLTFATPGDLAVTYTTQIGRYTKIGDKVSYTIRLTTSAFTHTTASGSLRVTGIPFTAAAYSAMMAATIMRGYTKANYTQVHAQAMSAAAYLSVLAGGSGQSPGYINTVDTPTGGTIDLYICGHYYV